MKTTTMSRALLCTGLLLGFAALAADSDEPPSPAEVEAVMHASFTARGQAGIDRLDRDPTQLACSSPTPPAAGLVAELSSANRAMIQYPADGKYLGDWKRGETIAQTGTGLQYSDDPSKPAGGNCYACHRLAPDEIAYGTIGPSLTGYGKARGTSPEVLKATWGMLYDMKGYSLCSFMPRFGAKGILTQAQLKDVMALLFDPASPVNQSTTP